MSVAPLSSELVDLIGQEVIVEHNLDSIRGWEGKLIGICETPSILVEDKEGERHYISIAVVRTVRGLPDA